MREIKERLGRELQALEHEFRVELPREIRTAVEMGDLRENAEYKAALERQAFVRARIGDLRERLASLNTLNLQQIPKDRTGLGSVVLLENLDSGEEIRYELVGPEVADLEKGLISIASPIGKSLVGSRAGDKVTVQIPAGRKRFEVLELQTIHDKKTDQD
jgi:transcription elongation factor GreA